MLSSSSGCLPSDCLFLLAAELIDVAEIVGFQAFDMIMMTFRHAIGMAVVMAVILHQAAANITPVAALLPRQSDGASGSPSFMPFSSPTGCDYGSDQSMYGLLSTRNSPCYHSGAVI